MLLAGVSRSVKALQESFMGEITADQLYRVNIGNALLYRLLQDLKLQGLQTNIALCVFLHWIHRMRDLR